MTDVSASLWLNRDSSTNWLERRGEVSLSLSWISWKHDESFRYNFIFLVDKMANVGQSVKKPDMKKASESEDFCSLIPRNCFLERCSNDVILQKKESYLAKGLLKLLFSVIFMNLWTNFKYCYHLKLMWCSNTTNKSFPEDNVHREWLTRSCKLLLLLLLRRWWKRFVDGFLRSDRDWLSRDWLAKFCLKKETIKCFKTKNNIF